MYAVALLLTCAKMTESDHGRYKAFLLTSRCQTKLSSTCDIHPTVTKIIVKMLSLHAGQRLLGV